MSTPASDASSTETISWLLRLRWAAVAGQLAVIAVAALVLGIDLPLQPLLWLLAVTAMSNGLLHDFPNPPLRNSEGFFALVIAADVALLTSMLYFTGGVQNPFTSFYLVHMTLAAMIVGSVWRLWLLVLWCACGFGVLFFFYHPLDPKALEPAFYQRGMAAAFLATLAWVAWCVARMQRTVREGEAQLAKARLRAARNEQFASLVTLSAGVAHELGSPLGTIAVVSRELERALEKSDASPGLLEDTRLIRDEVNRCRAILDRLNATSAGGIGEIPRPVTFDQLLGELETSLGAACTARLRAENRGAGSGETLLLPCTSVAQALGVLIQNGCDADTSGRPVTLECRPRKESVLFIVSDHGPGLSPEVLPRAGEPFYTTKPPGKGMGLGLFLVRTLATRLGGELTLASPPGGGTRATLLLPLASADEEETPGEENPARQPSDATLFRNPL